MLVRPQHRAIKVIQKAVTVRTQQRHIACCLDQRCLQVIIAGLGKAGGKTHPAAAPHIGKIAGDINHRMTIDPQKGRIRHPRQCGQTVKAGNIADAGSGGMDRPDITVKTGLAALGDDIFRPPAPKHHDRSRPEHPRQVAYGFWLAAIHAYPPNGRNRSRLMICRWISEVPSQIRSTRASRQNRASGRSSISPIPP